MAVIKLLVTLTATLIVYGVYQLAKVIYKELTSPIRDLPGPQSHSLLYGNLKEVQEDESVFHTGWVQKYGRVLQFKGLFSSTRLSLADPKALNHLLMNSYDYQKTSITRYTLSRVVGPGILIVEEDKHKNQRKIMNPAFSPAHIREHTDIFIEKAVELRDIWVAETAKQGGTGRIDVLSWLGKAALDIIGLAGFNYEFGALTNQRSELNDAFEAMFKTSSALPILPRLKARFPILRLIRSEADIRVQQAQNTMAGIGNQLLRESKAQAAGTGENKNGRDLLSLLVRANMATDIPESQRLSDQDVLAQVPTFFVAGHETTSNGTTWALFALTQSPRVQTKLRDELLTVDTDNPTMDQLNSLPYLDMVLRECLRLHPPVPATSRVAMKDDILPLSNPFTDRKGRVNHTLRKGKSRPERWESIPEASSAIPGVWGNMLTFLGGPRACIGFRFSLIEMKALLFTLVRAFEFELAVPPKDIIKRSSAIVHRPVLVTDPDCPNQMPLLVKPYNRT